MKLSIIDGPLEVCQMVIVARIVTRPEKSAGGFFVWQERTDEAKAREVWRWWEAQAANHTVAHPSRGGKRAVQSLAIKFGWREPYALIPLSARF